MRYALATGVDKVIRVNRISIDNGLRRQVETTAVHHHEGQRASNLVHRTPVNALPITNREVRSSLVIHMILNIGIMPYFL